MTGKNPVFLLLLLLVATLFSCQSDNEDPVPDVSDIAVDVHLKRFEQDFFRLDTNNLAPDLARLDSLYPNFTPIFFGQLLGLADPALSEADRLAYIRGFLSFPGIRRLYDTTQIVYPNLDDIRSQYQQAFQFYRYYFPKRPVPDVTTYISEFSLATFIYDTASLAVGLDFFLGSDYPYQQYNPGNSNFSAYLTRTFDRRHLVSKSLQPLVDDLLGPPMGERLLDMMLYNGKKLYILDRLLPSTPDSVLLEMTTAQTEWLFDNELEMWAYFLQENLLYSSKWQDIRKYVEYSPSSPGMPPEAPGRTADFIGWRIVREYMRRHPQATLDELIALRDAQQLLDASRYKPQRK